MWIVIVVVIVLIVLGVFSAGAEKARKEQAEAERRRRLELRKKAEQERLAKLTQKYGPDIARKLINENYFIGMTMEQLLDSKERQPDSVETQQLKTKTKEIWVYGSKSSGDWFVFEDGKAVKITDRPD